MNWQQIHSAPKYGTPIIAYWKNYNHCEMVTLHIKNLSPEVQTAALAQFKTALRRRGTR